MGPFDPDLIVVFPGILLFTAMILRFRLKKRELELRGGDPAWGPEADALRDDLSDTRARLAELQEHTGAQLADMQERLEFAERLLTAGRASQEEKGE